MLKLSLLFLRYLAAWNGANYKKKHVYYILLIEWGCSKPFGKGKLEIFTENGQLCTHNISITYPSLYVTHDTNIETVKMSIISKQWNVERFIQDEIFPCRRHKRLASWDYFSSQLPHKYHLVPLHGNEMMWNLNERRNLDGFIVGSWCNTLGWSLKFASVCKSVIHLFVNFRIIVHRTSLFEPLQ